MTLKEPPLSDLDNRLESLTDGPVPALAPAALVRRRGEQRRRRARLSVAAVSAAVLVSLFPNSGF